MQKLNWKIVVAFLTFFIGTFLALIWFVFDNKSLPKVETPLIISQVPESTSDNKILATLDVDSSNVTKGTENNPPIRTIKGSGNFCEKYILRKIASQKSADNRWIKLKNFNPNDENLLPNVKKWLQYMRLDELLSFKLQNNRQQALLLSSTSYGATGLATNLETWHIEIANFYSGNFWSFSKNPKLVFWDRNGLLNYYSVIYRDDFLSAKSQRDYENLTFNIEQYKSTQNGETQLINVERNLNCK